MVMKLFFDQSNASLDHRLRSAANGLLDESCEKALQMTVDSLKPLLEEDN